MKAVGHKKPPYVVQTRVLGGGQQNYAFASTVDPKLVTFNGARDVIAVASGHCHLWFQYAPPCNVRLAFYDAATLRPLRLFDLLAGPRVEHLAWHPTKPIVALATSMVLSHLPLLPSLKRVMVGGLQCARVQSQFWAQGACIWPKPQPPLCPSNQTN
jgi:hypothetical protein